MAIKTIIIGSSTAGKTTLLKYLKENTDLPIDESDDVLTALNGGVYPADSAYKMNVLAPKMVRDVLDRENIIFFTNTDYFTPADLQTGRKKGFKILLLSLDREKMTSRSRYRQKAEGYEDHTKYFDGMLAYQKKILDSGLVDAVIDTDKSVENIATQVRRYLNSEK